MCLTNSDECERLPPPDAMNVRRKYSATLLDGGASWLQKIEQFVANEQTQSEAT
jgi:hypothetical protein